MRRRKFECAHLVSQNGYADMALFVKARVVNLGGKSDLSDQVHWIRPLFNELQEVDVQMGA